jgi:hypothetical protein
MLVSPSLKISTPHTLQVPHPRCLPDGGVAGTRKAPSNDGAFSIFILSQLSDGYVALTGVITTCHHPITGCIKTRNFSMSSVSTNMKLKCEGGQLPPSMNSTPTSLHRARQFITGGVPSPRCTAQLSGVCCDEIWNRILSSKSRKDCGDYTIGQPNRRTLIFQKSPSKVPG